MRAFIVSLATLAGCGMNLEDDGETFQPDPRADVVQCPGAPGCEPSDDTTLRAGVAVRSVVPACFESWIDLNGNFSYRPTDDTFLDCGCDRLCPEDEGYPGPDEGEGDGLFRPIWVAGFQSARPAMGVRGADQGFLGEGDGLEARAVVFDQGNTRVALVAIDAMGWMYDDVLRMRAAVAEAGLDVDHLIVSSSHSHSAPDSMGIYGRSLTETGYDPEYAAQVDEAVVQAVTEAVEGLTEVTVRVGGVDANEAYPNGVANLIEDSRDPWIVDPRVGVMQLVQTDGATLATLVHWANHPETIGSRNALMSSGFVHGVRRVVSEGSRWADDSGVPGVGGTTVYLQGTVGGMMTSLGATIVDPLGNEFREASWDKTDTLAQLVGELALDALTGAVEVPAPELAVMGRTLSLPVDNTGFQVMFSLGVLDHRSAYDYDPDKPVSDDNAPTVRTEVDLLQVGTMRMLTIPGELLPENVIGGYDGRWLPPQGATLVSPSNPNPPDLTAAPAGPYLLDELGGEPSWILGLGNDEIGYIVPPYNFKVGGVPYLIEAEGDHYEETNSLGPETWPLIEASARELLDAFEGR